MTQNEKFQIQRRTARRNFWQRQGGYSALPPKLLFIPLYLAGAVFVWSRQDAISAQAGLSVRRLRRVREGSLVLGDLPAGKWRRLTAAETAALLGEGGTSSPGGVHTP